MKERLRSVSTRTQKLAQANYTAISKRWQEQNCKQSEKYQKSTPASRCIAEDGSALQTEVSMSASRVILR